MSNITVDFATYTTDVTVNGPFNTLDVVTLADTSTVLDGLSDAQINALTTNNVDIISATDGVLSWNADQFANFSTGSVAIDPGTFAVMADSGADISLLSAAQIAAIAAKGVAAINPTDSFLALNVAQFQSLGAMSVDASADFIILDLGANLSTGLSAGAISALGSLGVNSLDASDNVLSLSVAQYQALGVVTLTPADVVTLADTGAHLNALTLSDYGSLHANGIDIIDATDNAFHLSLAEFNALGGVTLTAADVVTLADTGATLGALTTGQIHSLAVAGIDAFDATDDVLSLSLAQYNQTVTDVVALTSTDTVTLLDTGAALGALSTAQIDALVNIDAFDASDNLLTLSVAQYNHLNTDNIALTGGDAVTISDTAANLTTLVFSTLAGKNVDFLDSTTAFTTLTVANLTALGAVAFTGASSVTLTDAGATIAGVANFATFASHGVDTLDASDDSLTISEAQYQALGSTHLTGADTVTISDTFANIGGGPSYSTLAAGGVDFLNATTAVNVTVANITDLGTVVFTPGSVVTLLDNGATIQAVADFTTFATHGVDTINATNDLLTINTTQFGALGAVTLTAGDAVTISDTAAHLGLLTLSALAGKNVDFLDSTTPFTLNVAQFTALGVVAFTGASSVTLSDPAANIQAVADFSTFAAHGIDTLHTTSGPFSFSVAEYSALGTTTVTGGDFLSIADSSANLLAFFGANTAAQITALLAPNGVDSIHTTSGSLSATAAIVSGVFGAGANFRAGDTVTLADLGANIVTLAASFSAFATGGVDAIDATDDQLSLTVAQYNNLHGAGVNLTPADLVTISDTAANLSALTTAVIATFTNVDVLKVNDSNPLDLTAAKLNALVTASVALTPADTVVLFDTEAHIEALTGAKIAGYVTQGIDSIDASDTSTLNLSASQISGVLGTAASFATADTVTLADTAANIASLTPTQFGQLATAHVDAINSTGTLNISVAQFQAVETVLHASTLTLTNPAVLSDTGAHLDALSTTEISQLQADNITTISASSEVDWTQAQVSALGATTISFTGGHLFVADTESNIENISTSTIDSDHTAGVTTFHATDHDVLNFTVAQAQHIIADSMSADNDTVTVTDTGGNISTLTTGQLTGFGAAGINEIVATTGDIVFTVAQLNADSVDTIKATGAHFILDDTEAHIEGNAPSDFARFFGQGVDEVESNSSDTILLSAADAVTFETHSAKVLFGDGVVSDSSTNINTMTVGQITALAAAGFGVIDATDDQVTFSAAQYNALGTVLLAAGDNVTLFDSGANLAALDFTSFAANGVNVLDASDNVLSLSVAKFNALGAVALTASDSVTVKDSAANITTLAFGTLAGKNVDFLDVTDPFSLVVARYLSLGAVAFASADTVTLSDSGADLKALSVAQIGALAAHGIDSLNATDNVLSLSVAQYQALGTVALTAGDAVTILDIGAQLATLDFTQLAANHVDFLDATDNVLAITVAQYQALSTVQLTATDVVTLNDTGANIRGLTATDFSHLAANGIDKIDASNNVLNISVAQFSALGAVTLTGSDSVTLLDTGAHLETLNFGTLASKGVDILDASDNVLTLTAAQFSALGTVSLKSSDTVTLLDSGSDISALTTGQFNALAAKGIDILDATDNAYSLTAAQVNGLGALTLASNDTITLSDTEANLEAETAAQLSNAVSVGIDIISSTGGTLNMTAAQVGALLGTSATFDAANTVTLADSGANIAGLNATQFGELAGAGVDAIHATGGTLSLSVAQYQALGAVTLTGTDTVTLADTAAHLQALTAAQIGALAAGGIDIIHSTGGALALSVAQYQALGSVALTAGDTVTLFDAGATISALTSAQIGALAAGNIDAIDASDNILTLNVAQYQALGTVTLTGGDHVTLADAGATLRALSVAQIGALAAAGVDQIDATNNILSLNAAQIGALGAVTLTAADAVTLADTESHIEALSGASLTSYAGLGVDFIHGTTNVLNMNASQVAAVLASAATFTGTDTVTLVDTAANISALSAAQFAQLAGKGVDSIHGSAGAVSLTVAQYTALGATTLTQADTVTLADTGAHLTALTSAQIQGLHAGGIDKIDSSTNAFTLTAADGHALVNQTGGGTVTIASNDAVTISDTGANITAMSATDLAGLSAASLGEASITYLASGAYSLSVDQYNAITLNGGLLTASDTIALTGTDGQLGAFLTPSVITGLGTNHIDSIDSTSDTLSLTQVQLDGLTTASVALTPADVVTFADTSGTIQGLSAAQFTGYAAQGVDFFDDGGTLTLNELQAAAVLDSAAAFTATDNVVISDTAAHLQLLSIAELDQFGPKGVDAIQISGGGTLTLSVAGYQALFGNTTIGGNVTLSDTGPDLATLTVAQLAGLADVGVSHIDATDNAISLSEAQTAALVGLAGSVTFDATDTLTVADLGASIALLTAANLTALAGMGAGHVVLDASDGVLTLTTAQYNAANTGSIALTAADFVTLADLGANLSGLTAGQIAAFVNIDALHATDGSVSFSIAQLNALTTANVALTAADTVTLSDTEANVEALTAAQITAYAAQGVDFFDPAGTLNMNESQVAAVLNSSAAFAGSENVTLFDTGAHISNLTTAQFGLLAARGVDHIDASDNVLSLTAAQYSGLGATTLSGGDVVTLADTGAAIGALTAGQFSQFAANGIDIIDTSDNVLTLSLAQFNGLSTVALTPSDTITLADIGATLDDLTTGQIAALAGQGIDKIDATDNTLSLTVAQFQALGTVTLAAGDVVTLADLGANLDGLTAVQIGQLAGAGIDVLDASDDTMALTVAQYNALGSVALTQADNVTLADLGAHIGALTAAQIGALAGHGIDTIDATNNAITFSLAKYNALGTVHLSLDDVVAVNGTNGTDLIQGQAGSQVLVGNGGDDVLFGQAGNDVLNGGLGNDTLNGGTGVDTATYATATGGVTVNLSAGTATGAAGTDLLSSIENATGSGFDDTLTGSSGNNVLIGGAGNDTLIGGLGADSLTGGLGADHFVYGAVADSPFSGAVDAINDFSHADGDKIDVSGIDAITGGADDPFTFVAHFTNHPGELEVLTVGTNIYRVLADINGDGTADLQITVHSTTSLVAGDFIL